MLRAANEASALVKSHTDRLLLHRAAKMLPRHSELSQTTSRKAPFNLEALSWTFYYHQILVFHLQLLPAAAGLDLFTLMGNIRLILRSTVNEEIKLGLSVLEVYLSFSEERHCLCAISNFFFHGSIFFKAQSGQQIEPRLTNVETY